MIAALLSLLAAFGDDQTEPRDKRVANLLQLTIELPETLTPEDRARSLTTLEADMATIRSCAGAEQLAARYQRERTFAARIVQRSDYPVGWMPPNLHGELVGLPTGHPTKVFGDRTTPRILIACTEPRLLPNGAAPPAP
ncbi:hypothetical protein ACFQ15_10650 [Sphingomonas hankookensis]|uniref:hypothetical protein n=1 Tax=Sphingomonas hankookensis TaxID=563996 RepID=UPI001F58EE4D|nr:hypothetical protein [Sphingomonas hankookensis]